MPCVRSGRPSTTATATTTPRRRAGCAAQGHEIDDLIAFRRKMGADVARTYPDTIEVDGKRRLRGAEHRVMPDRIETGTSPGASAATGARITLARSEEHT